MPAPSLGAPIARFYRLVLSNGATIRLPVVGNSKLQQVQATTDLFNNAQWNHHLETEASREKDRGTMPDMSDFYAKFGAKGAGKKAAGSSPSASGKGKQ